MQRRNSDEDLMKLLAQMSIHVHAELTPDEFVDKVARLIALEQILTEQARNPTIQTVTAGIFFGVVGTMIELGPDPELVNEFDDIAHMVTAHSSEARATAPENEKVAKALADFTMFRVACEQRAAVTLNVAGIMRMVNERMNENKPDSSAQHDNNSPDSPPSPRMN